MKQLASNIGQAVQRLEKDILPKAKQSPFEARDGEYLQQRLTELKRLHEQALAAPVFSIRFLGDTQNGKSTLINALLGRKILPEGHVGACSATIVRCRYNEQPKITVRFRYTSQTQLVADLAAKSRDAELALQEEESPANQREAVCNFLGRFLRLLDIDRDQVQNPADLIERCRKRSLDFPEKKLLGTEEILEATPENDQRIAENLSARGRSAFIVDECLIQGDFPGWHPSMELVDMPGTNAFNPWDDQVNTRLKQRVGGLAIVTSGTQLNDSVMEWFKETSILGERRSATPAARRSRAVRLRASRRRGAAWGAWAFPPAHRPGRRPLSRSRGFPPTARPRFWDASPAFAARPNRRLCRGDSRSRAAGCPPSCER